MGRSENGSRFLGRGKRKRFDGRGIRFCAPRRAGVDVREKFRKTWQGWIRSTEGYAIRAIGRSGIDFRDDHGQIHVDSEAMSTPWNEIIVYTRSIPDTVERPRREVLDRMRRAFDFAGWRLTLEDAWINDGGSPGGDDHDR